MWYYRLDSDTAGMLWDRIDVVATMFLPPEFVPPLDRRNHAIMFHYCRLYTEVHVRSETRGTYTGSTAITPLQEPCLRAYNPAFLTVKPLNRPSFPC